MLFGLVNWPQWRIEWSADLEHVKQLAGVRVPDFE